MSRIPLPLEVVYNVANFASDAGDTRTLAALARLSRPVNDAVNPILYRRLVLTRRNAPLLFQGLERNARPKNHHQTKAEYDAELKEFSRKFGRLIEVCSTDEQPTEKDCEDDFMGRGDWPSSYLDSEPETDDELSPEFTRKEEDKIPGGGALWDRRRELLKHCRHLTMLQVLQGPVLEDLMSLGEHGTDNDDEEEDDDHRDVLFPNLTHLAIGDRVVHHVTDYAARNVYEDETHDFLRFMKGVGSPKHVCITCVQDPTIMPHQYLFRLFRVPVDEIQAPDVYYLLNADGQFEYFENYYVHRDRRAAFVAGALPASVETLTVHNMRFPGPRESQARDYTVRVFYDDGGDASDGAQTVNQRAHTIARALQLSAPSEEQWSEKWEHIDVGRNIIDEEGKPVRNTAEAASKVRNRVAELMAANPALYAARKSPSGWWVRPKFEAEDKDAALEATAAAAEAEYEKAAKREGELTEERRLLQKAMNKIPKAKHAEREEAKRKYLQAEAAVRAYKSEYSRLMDESSKTREAAQDAAAANYQKRLAASGRKAAPAEERIAFAEGQDAKPCAVCWRRHTTDTRGIRKQVEHAWARG